jgi:hypothetical protein
MFGLLADSTCKVIFFNLLKNPRYESIHINRNKITQTHQNLVEVSPFLSLSCESPTGIYARLVSFFLLIGGHCFTWRYFGHFRRQKYGKKLGLARDFKDFLLNNRNGTKTFLNLQIV